MAIALHPLDDYSRCVNLVRQRIQIRDAQIPHRGFKRFVTEHVLERAESVKNQDAAKKPYVEQNRTFTYLALCNLIDGADGHERSGRKRSNFD